MMEDNQYIEKELEHEEFEEFWNKFTNWVIVNYSNNYLYF